MRPSARPSIHISTIPPLDLDLPHGKNAWILCGDCHRWAEAHRGLVQVHSADDVPCEGSRQHLIFDLTPVQHAKRRTAALAVKRQAAEKLAGRTTAVRASVRTATAVRTLAYPAIVPAVSQMVTGRKRAAVGAQTSGWTVAQSATWTWNNRTRAGLAA
jgi:hypothetical protein